MLIGDYTRVILNYKKDPLCPRCSKPVKANRNDGGIPGVCLKGATGERLAIKELWKILPDS